MAAPDHPDFLPPSDPDAKIWRYVDFSKFVHLLESATLFLSRADMFEDPFEGTLPERNVMAHLATPTVTDVNGNPVTRSAEHLEHLRQGNISFLHQHQHFRQWAYITCWHVGEYESDAMWKIYTKTVESVAIQSTFRRLRACLPTTVHLGMVRYLDFRRDFLESRNLLAPFVHKRRSYTFENELRGVEVDLSGAFRNIYQPGRAPHERKGGGRASDIVRTEWVANSEPGKNYPVSLSELIEKVYVSPRAGRWFSELVSKLTVRHLPQVPIEASELDARPALI